MALTKVTNRMIKENVFNVIDFGADPTGVADSRAAINDAFEACEAAGSGTVYFPGGTYYITNFIGSTTSANLTDIKIIGDRATINSNPPTYANYALYLQWPNLNSIFIDGLHIDGNTKTSAGIYINNTSASTPCVSSIVQNCFVENIHGVDNASVTVNTTAISMNSTFEGDIAQVINCTIENVTRDKVGLACTGIAITGFRVNKVSDNFIDNVRHSGLSGDKVDADGIKVFAKTSTVGSDVVYYDVNALIQNNAIYDCEGRGVKTQANGQVKIDNNSIRINNALELIDNYRAVDCQVGEGLVTNNDFFLTSNWTGGGSATIFCAQCPDESTYDWRSFTQTFSGNKMDIRKATPYVILPNPPATSTTYKYKLYLNITDNIMNAAIDADSNFASSVSASRSSHFIYVNNSSWPSAANMNGNMHWKIQGNIIDAYNFLTLTTGSENYTDKWFLHIHNNVKYPSGTGRNILSPGTSYTSNLSISNNHVGNEYTGGVYWNFDFTKLVAPCDFYVGNPTLTNGPSSYTYRNVQFNGAFHKVVDATGMYLSRDCVTWTRIT